MNVVNSCGVVKRPWTPGTNGVTHFRHLELESQTLIVVCTSEWRRDRPGRMKFRNNKIGRRTFAAIVAGSFATAATSWVKCGASRVRRSFYASAGPELHRYRGRRTNS